MNIIKTTTLIATTLTLLACGKEEGKPANVKVAFSNSTSASLRLDANAPVNAMPSYFGMKIVSTALRFDDDPSSPSTYGLESAIYAAPVGCANGGLQELEKDDKLYNVLVPPNPLSCNADLMEFIDFAQGSDAVNQKLNAGHAPILPGVYNQVYICYISQWAVKVTGHVEDLFVVDARNSSNYGISGCETSSLENLTINEGEFATVSLSYNLLGGAVVQVKDVVSYSSGPNCVKSSTDEDANFCINGLNPTPSAAKN